MRLSFVFSAPLLLLIRNLWTQMEVASKRAITPASLEKDAQDALKDLPIDAVEAAATDNSDQAFVNMLNKDCCFENSVQSGST